MYHHSPTHDAQATNAKPGAKAAVGGLVGVVALPVAAMVAMEHPVLAAAAVAGVVSSAGTRNWVTATYRKGA